MAQTYDPIRSACIMRVMVTSTAVLPRCLSATRQVRDGARHAPQIHISRRVCNRRGGAEFLRLARVDVMHVTAS